MARIIIFVLSMNGFAVSQCPSPSCIPKTDEYVTKDGCCCRYPETGFFITANCTDQTWGPKAQLCRNCGERRIVANCTYFADTKCEDLIPLNPTSEVPMDPPVLIILIMCLGPFAAVMCTAAACCLCTHPDYSKSPWIPHFPHCLLSSLGYQAAYEGGGTAV